MSNDDVFMKGDDLYDKGEYTSAFENFLKGAQHGDENSMSRVAIMYSDGEGVDRDYEKSIYWDIRAIEHGYVSSILNLAITYRIIGDMVQYRTYLQKSLAAGDDEAALLLAKLYLVSDKEKAKVKKYLEIAISSPDMIPISVEEAKAILSSIPK